MKEIQTMKRFHGREIFPITKDKIYVDAGTEKLYTEAWITNHAVLHPTDLYGQKCYVDKSLDIVGFTGIYYPWRDELDGKTVRCNYEQLFLKDSYISECTDMENEEIFHYVLDLHTLDREGQYPNSIDCYVIDEATAKHLMKHTDEYVFYYEPTRQYVLWLDYPAWDDGYFTFRSMENSVK